MKQSSIQAHNEIKKGGKQKHYNLILEALNSIEKGTCKDILQVCDLTYHQIQRRVSEMCKLNMIETNERKENEKFKPHVYEIVK